MSNTDVKKLIEENYKVDVSSIRNLSKLSNDLTRNGKLVVPGGLDVIGPLGFLPKGSIIAFNGKTEPKGWALCDGKNGTPDLRGRFILAAGNGSGLSGRTLNQKGGSETHKLTINEMPSHNHSMNDAGNHSHGYWDSYYAEAWGNYGKYGNRLPGSRGGADGDNKAFAIKNITDNSGNHKHSINNNGGNKPHNNMPPFYVLTYIMKL